MTLITFIVVLVLLIVVHEIGHFVAAKAFGMRVLEFGLGYPPKLFGIRRGETEYTVNALPFGGFVKILGEELSATDKDPRSFASKPRWQQAIVLFAGVCMNVLLAWGIFVFLLLGGIPQSIAESDIPRAKNVALMVSGVVPDSPAYQSALTPGARITAVRGETAELTTLTPGAFTAFIDTNQEETITLVTESAEGTQTTSLVPKKGILENERERSALGIALTLSGVIERSFFEAIVDGWVVTVVLLKNIVIGLTSFFVQVFTLSANFSDISGPVGIALAVGDASALGWYALLQLTAIISLNLAIINLIPIPALDGGRLLFVLIESVIRRPIHPSVAGTANALGFGFLILLMVLVTASDVIKIF